MEVTPKCNLKCPFCYNVWTDSEKEETEELSLPDVRLLASRLSEVPGLQGVTLSGGEPLLRSDITEIAKAFSRECITVAIATNGTLLTRELAVQLADSGVEHFDIGFTDPCHETVLALTHAVRTGCTVTASLCIHRENYKKTGIRVRAASALGADSVCLNRFVPTGRGRKNRHSLSLSMEELYQALELAQKAADSCPVHMFTGIPVVPDSRFPSITFSTCRCGDTKWAISPAGLLRTCEQNCRVLGNLLANSFTEIVRSREKEIKEFRRPQKTGCRFLPG